MRLPWAHERSELPRRRRLDADQLAQRNMIEHKGQKLFRRNRTLVGSLSFQVRSTGELTGDLQSPRAHFHHLAAHRRMIVKALLIVLTASCCLIWLLYNLTAKIDIAPTDAISIDERRYQDAINGYFLSHPIERLRPLTNVDELSKYMTEVVPEVAGVEMSGASGFASTHFDLLFRRPVASWQIGQARYYVDQYGISFQVNYFDNPVVKIIDNSGVPQSAGTTIASGRFLRFVGRTVTPGKRFRPRNQRGYYPCRNNPSDRSKSHRSQLPGQTVIGSSGRGTGRGYAKRN